LFNNVWLDCTLSNGSQTGRGTFVDKSIAHVMQYLKLAISASLFSGFNGGGITRRR
jgi:hypothetical protein